MISIRCPICGRLIESDGSGNFPTHPFCSDRCRLIDLGRWLGEATELDRDPKGKGRLQTRTKRQPPKPAALSAVIDRREAWPCRHASFIL